MQFITRQKLAGIINQLGPEFDAHELEQRVLRLHPIEFAEDLRTFHHTTDPLQQFSAAFAKFVDSLFSGQITKTQKVTSCNLGGLETQNQQWRKLVPLIS